MPGNYCRDSHHTFASLEVGKNHVLPRTRLTNRSRSARAASALDFRATDAEENSLELRELHFTSPRDDGKDDNLAVPRESDSFACLKSLYQPLRDRL